MTPRTLRILAAAERILTAHFPDGPSQAAIKPPVALRPVSPASSPRLLASDMSHYAAPDSYQLALAKLKGETQ